MIIIIIIQLPIILHGPDEFLSHPSRLHSASVGCIELNLGELSCPCSADVNLNSFPYFFLNRQHKITNSFLKLLD